MNKLQYILTAGAMALFLGSGLSGAADNTPATDEPAARSSENQPGDPAAVVTDPAQADQEEQYMAALQKCDALDGGDKQKCVDAAKRKFSRM